MFLAAILTLIVLVAGLGVYKVYRTKSAPAPKQSVKKPVNKGRGRSVSRAYWAKVVREIAEKGGMSNAQIAREVGVSTTYPYYWASGKAAPSDQNKRKLRKLRNKFKDNSPYTTWREDLSFLADNQSTPELAREIGVEPHTVLSWIGGRRGPSPKNKQAIAQLATSLREHMPEDAPQTSTWSEDLSSLLRRSNCESIAGNLGVHEKTVQNWEKGRSRPRYKTRRAIVELAASKRIPPESGASPKPKAKLRYKELLNDANVHVIVEPERLDNIVNNLDPVVRDVVKEMYGNGSVRQVDQVSKALNMSPNLVKDYRYRALERIRRTAIKKEVA